MTKEQQFKQEEININNAMDREAERKNAAITFIPIVGMQPISKEGNGYKGIIEYVGKDYFILRCFRTGDPILIKPHQYHNFEDYTENELVKPANLHRIFQDIVTCYFPSKK